MGDLILSSYKRSTRIVENTHDTLESIVSKRIFLVAFFITPFLEMPY